jgi:fructose-bisphosphate aldolase, class II
LPLATLRQVLDEAAKGGYGVGAFNANNMEQVQGIVGAAQEVSAPVIVQVSRGALAYAGKNYLRHLITAAAESAPEIPIVLHLDHGDKPETCFDAIELGFTSVMMDGSLLADGKTPSDYEYNVGVPRRVVEAAHAKGVSVEGEPRHARRHRRRPRLRPGAPHRPGAGSRLRREGGCRCARRRNRHEPRRVQVHGQAHRRGAGNAPDEEIHQKLPDTHLVMHGSSSVPQELVDRINAAGGKLVSTFGVLVSEIKAGIRSACVLQGGTRGAEAGRGRAPDAVRRRRARGRLRGAVACRDDGALCAEPGWRVSPPRSRS